MADRGTASERAVEAAEAAYMERFPAVSISTVPRDILSIAHDPALGLDRSVRLDAMYEFVKFYGTPEIVRAFQREYLGGGS